MQTIDQIETPALLLESEKLKANVARMHQHVAQLGGVLRPHGKTIKSVAVWDCMWDRHVRGITVSTLLEAEYYFESGVTDILYAVGIVPNKLERAARLIQRGADLKLLLESVQQVEQVAAVGQRLNICFPVLVEIDSDGHRAGLKPNDSELIRVAQYASELEGIQLIGVMTHAGASYQCESIAAIRAMAEQERQAITRAASNLRTAGFPCPVVSLGSTPTAQYTQCLDDVTEVRAGVYPFHDLVMAGLGVCELEDIAISVLSSVIGHQGKETLIIDAGWMALSRDRGTAKQVQDQGYGLVCDQQGIVIPELLVKAVSQEHGQVHHRSGQMIDMDTYPIGTLLRILPNHACATAAMHSHYFVVDASGSVNNKWDRINGW